jgi:phosphonate transport system substrate-binding protein
VLSFAAVAHSERTRQAIGAFCDRLTKATGIELRAQFVGSYAALIQDALLGAMDLSWAPPLVAVELENRNVAVSLVAVTRSVRAAYHSALFTLSQGPLQSISDLRGATVAWVSRESASGYFVPRWHLHSIGCVPADCFAREIFCESHEAVVGAVLDGRADVGATHVALEPVSGQLASAPWLALGARPSSIRVLLLLGPIPGDVIAASHHVPPAARRAIAAALLSMNERSSSSAFDATRFEPVSDGHLHLLKGLYQLAEGVRF